MKGPIRQNSDRKNRVRKQRVVRRIYGMKYSWKGHIDRNRHQTRTKRSGQAWLVYVRHKPWHPHHVKGSPQGLGRNRKTIWLIIMHHHTKFGVKGSAIQKISSGHTYIDILNFALTLTLNTTIKFLHKTLCLMIMYCQTKFGSKRISSSEDIIETVIVWSHELWTLAVTLTLKTANKSFCTALWLMMMHQNTKFGNRMFGGLDDIIWTNTDILTLCCDLDLECSNQFFFIRHSGLRWSIIRPCLVVEESTLLKI